MWGVSLTHPVLASFLCGEFILHIPCWLLLFIWRISLTHPMLVSLFIGGVSLTHLLLASFLSGEFLLHIRAGFIFMQGVYRAGFSSFTSHAGFVVVFIWGVSLTHPVLGFFFFYRRSFSYTSPAGFIFVRGVSLTHPVLPSFFCGEFLLHIPCWFHFYLGSFSYTSHAGFLFIWGVCIAHPVQVSLFIWGVSRTHPVLASFLCGELLWYAVFSEDNPWRKELGGRWPREKKVKKSHSKQRRNPTTPYTEQNKTKQKLSDKWPQKIKGNKRNGS